VLRLALFAAPAVSIARVVVPKIPDCRSAREKQILKSSRSQGGSTGCGPDYQSHTIAPWQRPGFLRRPDLMNLVNR